MYHMCHIEIEEIAVPTRINVRHSVTHPEVFGPGWRLLLQWGSYIHKGEDSEDGYRFIWKRPDGSLQAARGQARIPSLAHARLLMALAEEEGWGDNMG